jgi:predicted DNA-binding ribbon-helix-helix protein
MNKRGPKRKHPLPTGGIGPLRSQNVVVDGHRTSMRLEPSMWDALEEIAAREGMTVNTLCSEIRRRLERQAELAGTVPNPSEVTLTAAVRTFMVCYFRRAGTEDGHRKASHGAGSPFAGTPFDLPDNGAAMAEETAAPPAAYARPPLTAGTAD